MQVMIRNRHTNQIKYVPEQTADDIKNEDWLKKDWEVVPRTTPPYEVVQYSENKKKEEGVKEVEQFSEAKEEIDITSLTVREIEKQIDSFTEDQLAILADDPRVSVKRLLQKYSK